MRTIGVDYDDTFSVNPEVWAAALRLLKQAGFTIIGVTFRNREQEITCEHYHAVCDEIIYTAGTAKHHTSLELGRSIDIWIDDKPNWVHQSWEDVYGAPDSPWVSHPGNLKPVRLQPFQPMPIHTNPDDPV